MVTIKRTEEREAASGVSVEVAHSEEGEDRNDVYREPAVHETGHWLMDTFEGLVEQYAAHSTGLEIKRIRLHVLLFSAGKMLVVRPATALHSTVYSKALVLGKGNLFVPLGSVDKAGLPQHRRILDHVIGDVLLAGIKEGRFPDLQFLDFLYQNPVTELTPSVGKQDGGPTLDVAVCITLPACSLPSPTDHSKDIRDVDAAWVTPEYYIIQSLYPRPLASIATYSWHRYLDSSKADVTGQLFPGHTSLQDAVRAILVGCIYVRESLLNCNLENVLICLKHGNSDLGLFLVAAAAGDHLDQGDEGRLCLGGDHYTVISRERGASVGLDAAGWSHPILSSLIDDGGRLAVKWIDP